MISKIVHIPVTEKSHPFAHAAERCNFSRIGYIEDEYFFYGTANVYSEGDNYKPKIIYKDAEYVNRFLVRRPADVSRFSGNIVVEILNPTALMDIDRMWVNSWKYFTRNGDIYIGITSKPDVLQSLYDFDIDRYREISWKNPLPDREPPKKYMFKFFPQYEAGLFWDMLTDLAKLFRSREESNPIAQYSECTLYLTGWSQSAAYVVRYVKSFAYLEENCKNGPIFDGYLSAGGGCNCAPMNSYEYKEHKNYFGTEGAGLMGAREPYIAINTESENTLVNWKGDSDEPENLFRIYEIAGSSHDTEYNLLTYYKDDEDTVKTGTKPVYPGIEPYPNDYPYEYIFNAAFRNLYCWVRQGVPAPHADRIPIDSEGKNVTDAFGNAVGGIRTPAIDYPTARYYSYSTLKDGGISFVFGHIDPFPKEMLKALYGSLENYKKLVEKGVDRVIAQGFIMREDRQECIDRIVEAAKKRGL
jgi:hypothetical protein